jgi:enamine deaminase RidA (YjgF/YER057c/UK114 family)
MPGSLEAIARSFPLRVSFAGVQPDPIAIARINTPWLAGAASEELFPSVIPLGTEHAVRLFRAGDLWLGYAHEPFAAADLAARTELLYQRILAVTQGRHLYRVWNYVPQINAQVGGLENYRAFCQGRSFAFEATLGGQFQPQLPAASAVGCEGPRVEAIFVAGEAMPFHFENPEQVPAYLYPTEHGPRPPSFARATVARSGRQTWTFISGTSAIKGHQTVAPGALNAQLECTLDNLRLISRQAGLGDDLGSGKAKRQFKVYLRHRDDLPATRARLERSLFRPDDVITYLHAEICRAALNIEIEATLLQ